MNKQIKHQDVRLILIHVAVCAVIFTFISVLQNYSQLYRHLYTEDLWGEYATFTCFLLASLAVACSIGINPDFRRAGYVLMCLGLFFIAMEEISWGQRLLGINAPRLFAQYNSQEEINIHNLVMLGDNYLRSLCNFAIIVWVFLLPILIVIFRKVKGFVDHAGIPIVPVKLMVYFLFALVVLNFDFFDENEEICELLFGFSFIMLAADILHQSFKRVGRKTWSLPKITVLLCSVAFLLAIFFAKLNLLRCAIYNLGNENVIIYPKGFDN